MASTDLQQQQAAPQAPPRRNLNQISEIETPFYDMLITNEYQLHDYGNFRESQNYSPYHQVDNNNYKFIDPNMNLSNPELMKLSFGSMPPSSYSVLNYNNNNNRTNKSKYDQRANHGVKYRPNFRANSPKGYNSDDSNTSQSSTDTSDNNKSKWHRPNDKRNNNNNNNNNQNKVPTRVDPKVYNPSSNYNKSRNYAPNQYQHQCNSRPRQPKSTDIMVRRAHGLMERFKSRAYKMQINPNPPNLLNGGPWDQLNKDIWDVFMGKIQKEQTYVKKLNLWKSIFLFIRKCLNNYGLFLVGSTMSGFGLEGSDIDMCLLTKPFINEPRVDSLHHLSLLKNLLLKSGLASEAELIMAKVPILKFKNDETGFEIDLNCNNSVGIQNTHLLHCYAQLDWRVRPLVVIVKLWAQANRINDAKNMTISSYSWALMVIHYLQCGVSPPVLPCLHGLAPDKFNSQGESHKMDVQEEIDVLKDYDSNNTSCLGDLLIGFFHYYSYFNYSQYAISVRKGARIPIDECKYLKSPKNDPNQWKCLCIEEPFDFSNTARSVFDLEIFKHIKEIIICSYKELARNKTLNYILPVNLNKQR